MRIAAATIEDFDGPLVVKNLNLQDPGPDEVLVRMVGVGICHTNLFYTTGVVGEPLPQVLSHEGSGVAI